VFKDIDGSIGGGPNSYIVIDNGIAAAADDKDCRIEPTWGAAVCKGDLGRLTIGAAGGARGGAGGGAPAAGRGGAPGPGAPAAPGAAAGGRGAAPAVAVAAVPAAPGQGRGGPGAVPPAPGAAAPRGGGGGGRGNAAPPIVLTRNGRNFTVTGATNVRNGTEIKATTEQSPVNISLSELDSGSWVIFELPGFTTANAGTAQNSLDALRSASATSYYKGDGTLWVKVVSSGGGAAPGGARGGRGGPATAIQVSR